MCAPKTPDYAGAANAQGQANLEASRLTTQLNRANQYTPWGSQTWNQDAPDQWSSTITLDPTQQNLLDSQNRISQNLADTGEAGLSRVGSAMATPFSTNGLPQLSGGPGGGNYQSKLDTSGLTALPGVNDFSADRQRVEDSIMSRNNTDFARDEESMRQRLANQGISAGSDAWNREFDTLNRAKVDARNQAILAGGQEQSRLFGLGSSARAQQFGEQQGQGQFSNDATSQQLAALLASGNANNQARQQGIQEQAYTRQLPLNELNALRTGSQVSSPTFGATSSGTNVQAAPPFQAAQQTGADATSGYNNMLSGLFGLGSAFLMSDRRVKRDIVRIGATEGGLPLYSFRYLNGEPAIGVMADEAALMQPAAVARMGQLQVVNYGRVK